MSDNWTSKGTESARTCEVLSFSLETDGEVPNNPSLALLIYRSVLAGEGMPGDAEAALDLFSRNGWAGGWVNGIYPFHHYHARAHEVLANLGDPVAVQFGGARGPRVNFQPGDVAIIPAGCGHCRKSDPGRLVIVGAYPRGQEAWDLKRATARDYAAALLEIPRVGLPATDPVFGDAGPLLDYWS